MRCCEGGAVLVGRRDSQVKLNGQRIELGEVEGGVMRAGGGSNGNGILSAAGFSGITDGHRAVNGSVKRKANHRLVCLSEAQPQMSFQALSR